MRRLAELAPELTAEVRRRELRSARERLHVERLPVARSRGPSRVAGGGRGAERALPRVWTSALGSRHARAERHRDRACRPGAVDRVLPAPRRRLPRGREGHIEATLPSGVRFMLDAEEVVTSFRPDWTREVGQPARARLRVREPGRGGRTLRARDAKPDSRPRRSRGTRSGVSATRSCGIPTACRSTSSRRSALDVAGSRRLRRGGRARGLRQLAQDVRDVPVHGVLAEDERRRDLPIREPGGDESEHLGLATR